MFIAHIGRILSHFNTKHMAPALGLALLTLGACGEEEDGAPWTCDADHHGWARCSADGQVESCHGTKAPHFHGEDDCAAQGLSCAETAEGQATCVGEQACEASQTRCEGDKAYTCKGGALQVQTCNAQEACALKDGEATCVLSIPPEEICGGHGELHGDHCHCEEGYVPAADDALRCVLAADPDPDPAPTPDGYNFTATRHTAAWGLDEDGKDAWTYIGQADVNAQLIIENLVSYGGRDMTGEYTIGPDEQDYGKCGFCVLLETQCHSHGSDLHCERTYMPKSGRFSLTKLDKVADGRFAGQLDDMVFQLVTIDPQTLETTPAANAPEVKLSMSFVWDAPLSVNQAPAPECGGHGHLHGDECHCDEGYVVDPQDSKNCIAQ